MAARQNNTGKVPDAIERNGIGHLDSNTVTKPLLALTIQLIAGSQL